MDPVAPARGVASPANLEHVMATPAEQITRA